MKDGTKTFWLSVAALAAATVLAVTKIIDAEAWMWVTSVAVGAKGIQGAADRFKPNSNPSTRK